MLGVTTIIYIAIFLVYNALVTTMGYDFKTIEYWLLILLLLIFSFATLIHFEPEKYLKGDVNDTTRDSKQEDEKDDKEFDE